jgi:ribosomal protein L3 glutamine methyltransferase
VADRITVYRGDLFEPLPPEAEYDLIVTNPPYVIGSLIDSLSIEVRSEPSTALHGGGSDGLDIITRILRNAGRYLSDNGVLMIEMDDLQTETAATKLGPQLLNRTGRIIKDLAGKKRVVLF